MSGPMMREIMNQHNAKIFTTQVYKSSNTSRHLAVHFVCPFLHG